MSHIFLGSILLLGLLTLTTAPTITTIKMKDIYYLDSAASYHMTGNLSKMTDIYKLEVPIKIQTGNGPIWIEYAGSTYFIPFEGTTKPIKLEHTLFNPVCKANLISLGLVMKHCVMLHKADTLEIYLKSDTSTPLFTVHVSETNVFPAGRAVEVTGDSCVDSPQYVSLVSLITKGPEINAQLLHKRLAHVGYTTLIKMENKGLFEGLEVNATAVCVRSLWT